MGPRVVLAIAFASLACSRTNAVVDAGPPPPPAVHWTDRDLVVDGHPEWKLRATLEGDGAHLVVASFPSGTELSFGGRTTPADAVPKEAFDVGPKLGAVPVFHPEPDAGRYFPPDVDVPPLPLEVRLPTGATIVTSVPVAKAPPSIVSVAMARAAREGLSFDGEGTSGAHSIYLVDPDGADEVVGPASTLSMVDRVAIATRVIEPASGTTCAFAGGKRFPLENATVTVTVYGRRDHARLDARTFPPAPGCPMDARDERAVAVPARATLLGWLAELAR